MTETIPPAKKGKRWMIRVTFSGGDAYLRHGSRVGSGSIVQFRSKRDAEVNIDLISPGFDQGTVAVVVPYDKSEE